MENEFEDIIGSNEEIENRVREQKNKLLNSRLKLKNRVTLLYERYERFSSNYVYKYG